MTVEMHVVDVRERRRLFFFRVYEARCSCEAVFKGRSREMVATLALDHCALYREFYGTPPASQSVPIKPGPVGGHHYRVIANNPESS